MTFALRPGILAYHDLDMSLVVTPSAVQLAARTEHLTSSSTVIV